MDNGHKDIFELCSELEEAKMGLHEFRNVVSEQLDMLRSMLQHAKDEEQHQQFAMGIALRENALHNTTLH